MSKSNIEWTEVPGFKGVAVTEDGAIRGPLGRVLKPLRKKSGHRYVTVGRRDDRKNLHVHHAVLLAFVGPRPEGQEARHLNDDKSDNRVTNLVWGTRLENAADSIRNGTESRGERSGTAKLTESQVIELRRMQNRPSLRTLAAKYGVSHTAIRRAITGMKWSYLDAVN